MAMSSIFLALVSALALVSIGDLRIQVESAIFILVAWGALVWVLPRPRFGIKSMVLTALILRMILVMSPVSLSDDVFRYLWEGHVAWAGGNPYLHPPDSAVWGDAVLGDFGASALRKMVAHPQVSAIYPPLAIWFFGLLAQISLDPWVAKVAMGLADVGVVWFIATILAGRQRHLGPAWLYALHPLGAVESAGSAHMEPLAILFLLAAIRSWDRRGGGAAFAVLGLWFKLLPGVVLVRLWRGRPLMLLAAMGVGFLSLSPFVDAGPALGAGFLSYTTHWSFNGSLFLGFEWLFGVYARPVAIVVGALLVLRAAVVNVDPLRIALWAGGAFVLLSPTVHPWYVLWAWVPALMCGVRSWTVLATLVPLSYVALASYDPLTHVWEEAWWPPLLSTLPFGLALIWESFRHATQPGPWAPGATPLPPQSASQTEQEASTLFRR
jgi:hypothetical protein